MPLSFAGGEGGGGWGFTLGWYIAYCGHEKDSSGCWENSRKQSVFIVLGRKAFQG